MDIRIDNHSLELPGTASIEHRAQRALARFADGVERLAMTLRDDNGPRGGRDKTCTLRIDLRGGGQIVVVDRSTSLKRAIARGLRRGRRLVASEHKRRRALQRQRRLGGLRAGMLAATS